MSSHYQTWEVGERIAVVSMLPPGFMINQFSYDSTLVISHGRREELAYLCHKNYASFRSVDITSYAPNQKERAFSEIVATAYETTLILTDTWWLSQAAITRLLAIPNKRVVLFCQFPEQIVSCQNSLSRVVMGPCDLVNGGQKKHEFGGMNLQECSLRLQYQVGKFIEYVSIDKAGQTQAFQLSISHSKRQPSAEVL